ncbi:hypothetical protein FDO65_10210 [Nakamurella flava]|uniref:Uncharacterized protein n=1 Tax=Nakamurella flava TaxID=2576308 RepID=A0A4U6QNV9_9ACTN|nr:hypothetical protein [Nakamurella flava]TKV61888.1 hypothetical protein FDO65_10210 [Nakamurella flava]
MPTATRLQELSLTEVPLQRARLLALTLEAAEPATKPRLLGLSLEADGVVPATQVRPRLASLSLSENNDVLGAILTVSPAGKLEPGQRFSITAAGSSGSITGYAFEQTGGPAVPGGLPGSGNIRYGVVPLTLPQPIYDSKGKWAGADSPQSLEFAVSVTDGTSTSSATVQVPFASHLRWTQEQPSGKALPVINAPIPLPGPEPVPQAPLRVGTLNTNSVGNSATVLPTYRAGKITDAMQEWRMSSLYPTPFGAIDSASLDAVLTKLDQFRTLGFRTTIGLGMHYQPAALAATRPLGSSGEKDIRFVSHDGLLGKYAGGGDMIDMVWSADGWAWCQDYLNKMADAVDLSKVDAIRVTAHRSEVLYPENPSTRLWWHAPHVQNGGAGLAGDQDPAPFPGWVGGTAGLTLDQRTVQHRWYVRSLVQRHNAIANLLNARGFRGTFLWPMPGVGSKPQGLAADLADLLPQTRVSARGVAWHLVADEITVGPYRAPNQIMLWASSVGEATTLDRVPSDADINVPLDSTTYSRFGSLRTIKTLADRHGFRVGGENPGYSSGIATDYNDTSSAGMMARALAEVAPAGARHVDRFDWAHGTTLTPELLTALTAHITRING